MSKEIIELSTRYGVISRETSFVAIERRETPVLGDTGSFHGYRSPYRGMGWSRTLWPWVAYRLRR